MNTKEMIEWLRKIEGFIATVADVSTKDKEVIAAIIKTLKEYTTLKKEYAEYDKLIRPVKELRKRIHHRS